MKSYNRLSDVQQDLKRFDVTCVELVKYYSERIEKYKHLNAFVEVFDEDAMQQASRIDTKIKSGKPLGKLFGLVIGIKDVICIKGNKVTASSKILNGFESLYSATAVERLLKEDAIIIGRLNCDEFAMGSSNENSTYGPARNFLDNDRVPGGSSGGSAVAVQADLCLATLGTDTGGSVRQPASFCGIVGLKPTYGLVSRYGLIAYASSFDQIGPLTKTVEDAARILEVIAGADDFDSAASVSAVPEYSKNLKEQKQPRIAYIKDALDHPGLNPEIREKVTGLLDSLKVDGVTVEAIDFPLLNYIIPTYYILTTAEASSNLSRFDGIRYGYRFPDAENMETTYKKTRTIGFGKEVKRRIMLGTFVLSSGYYDAYYQRAQRVRRMIVDELKQVFRNYDLILIPTTPNTAFKIGEKTKDPIAMYLEDIYTVVANLAGIPAVSIPLFQHEQNQMPFGIQLMADKFAEEQILSFAHHLMENFQESPKVVAG